MSLWSKRTTISFSKTLDLMAQLYEPDGTLAVRNFEKMEADSKKKGVN